MPTITIFIALAIILAIVLAYVIVLPWFREYNSAGNKKDNKLIALNVEVFQDRITELQADYESGQMSKSAFITQKTELERQLLQASAFNNTPSSNSITTEQLSESDTISKNEPNGISDKQLNEHQLNDAHSYYKFNGNKKARTIVLICVPLLIGLIYILAEDRTPVKDLWNAQDDVGEVADDLLTGKIDTPPEWATKDNVALLNAIQTNVHHHAHDAQRWMRLSDIYLAFKADNQALEAISRAYRIKPSDETIAVRYAQTQFFVNGGMLSADGLSALQQVLKQNPEHQGAQMLMVMGEARRGNYDNAQAWINRLRDGIMSKEGDHSQAIQSLDELSQNIQAQQQASLSADPQTLHTDKQSATGISSLNASVKINSSLIPLIETGDTLFVTIQEETGGAPLAVKRLPANQALAAKDHTLKVNLSDNDAMMPTHTISAAINANKKLVATARISKSGQAMSESGDLRSDSVPLQYTERDNLDNINIVIEINQKLP